MDVSSILKQKGGGGTGVVTAKATSTVMEAARQLAEHRIGAIVVTAADGTVAGILSERDIVRRLAEAGPEILTHQVGEVMTRNVVTCTADSNVNELMTKMTRGRFRHLPVVDGAGRLQGIVSIGDVVKVHVAEVEGEASALFQYITTH